MAVSGEHRPPGGSLPGELASGAPFLSLKLHVLIGILALCALSVALLVYLCVRLGRASKKRRALGKNSSLLIPLVSKEIVEISPVDRADRCGGGAGKVEIVVVVELKGENKRGDAEIGSGSGSGDGDGGKKSGENSRLKARVSNVR